MRFPRTVYPLAAAAVMVLAAGVGAAPVAVGANAGVTPVTSARWYPSWEPGDRGQARSWPTAWPRPIAEAPTAAGPLTGRTIVIDPGHNSGNESHVRQINRHYWVGLDKICNTTGTETRSGYKEAAYTFDVAKRLAVKLRAAGARVVLTRDRDGQGTYGPCIQARGLLAGTVRADITVSIHADGGPSSGRGAFVYTPARMTGYTSSTKADRSYQLAASILRGFDTVGLRRSTYLVPNIARDRQQGTLNTSPMPVVIVETLNMANRRDAAIAESPSGRSKVAAGLYAGITRYFR